ncbi:MAG: Hsp20/alpha crystallin family protein [Bacteriovorax sp.]|nr:Hsp20/alpha crystallin family protein [Bacteriovorax sp.]
MNIVPKKSTSTVPSLRNKVDNDLISFQKDMNNLMGNFFNRGELAIPQIFETSLYPSVDIREKDNKYLLDADLPGMKDSDISIDFYNNTLTIKGEKKSELETKDEGYLCVERSYGSFQRDIPFEDAVNEESIKAELKNGVLHVELTKKEKAPETHRKIQIKH